MAKSLRKLLQTKIELNPFNDNFKIEKYLDILFAEIDVLEIQKDELYQSLPFLPVLNIQYKSFYNFLKNQIHNCNLTFEELLDLVFVALNRNYFIYVQDVKKKKKKRHSINDFLLERVKSIDDSLGDFELSSALENDIDSLNILINYLRYFKDYDFTKDNSKAEILSIDKVKELVLTSAYYHVQKAIYDEFLWEDGTWKIENIGNKPQIQIKFKDPNLLILNKVGHYRLQRNIVVNYSYISNSYNKKGLGVNPIAFDIRNKYKEKRIKSVNVNQGELEYELAKGLGENELLIELKNRVAYSTYYNFLDNQSLPELENLSLIDLLKLFGLLQDLIEKASEKEFDTGIKSLNESRKFPIRIRYIKLKEYFTLRSQYTLKQIIAFIKRISFEVGDRINLWDKPLVRYGANLYLNYLPTIAPIIYNLIDFWIENGGFNLDERGKLLEQYLRKSCSQILKRKNFTGSILTESSFYNKSRQKEEIDLVLILKHVIVIAEVKCIKYPFESRDAHNTVKRLHKAAKQIKRKKDFLDTYRNEISGLSGFIEDKEIIPIVITNFPSYSGHMIDEIPITDYYLFESYFNSGQLTIEPQENNCSNADLNNIKYYLNEQEMNNNISTFFKAPVPIEVIKNGIQIHEKKYSSKNMKYDLFVQTAEFTNRLM